MKFSKLVYPFIFITAASCGGEQQVKNGSSPYDWSKNITVPENGSLDDEGATAPDPADADPPEGEDTENGPVASSDAGIDAMCLGAYFWQGSRQRFESVTYTIAQLKRARPTATWSSSGSNAVAMHLIYNDSLTGAETKTDIAFELDKRPRPDCPAGAALVREAAFNGERLDYGGVSKVYDSMISTVRQAQQP